MSARACLHAKAFKPVVARRLFSSSASAPAPAPVIPPFDYQPRLYNGPSSDEILLKRKKFLGPSLFYYYQKPVCDANPCFFLKKISLFKLDVVLFYLFLPGLYNFAVGGHWRCGVKLVSFFTISVIFFFFCMFDVHNVVLLRNIIANCNV